MGSSDAKLFSLSESMRMPYIFKNFLSINTKKLFPSRGVVKSTQEQLRALEKLNFTNIHTKCQQELESWHSAAIGHLGQIYSQRLTDLAQVYTQDVCPDAEKYKQKVTEQLKHRIMPRINKILDDPTPDPEKVEKMQNILCHMKSECNMMRDRQWIRIQLPDIKSLSIPIKIIKTAVSSHLSEHGKELFEGILVDMCWMPSISVFVILTIHSVYLYDPLKSKPNLPVKIDAIQPLDRTHALASLSPFERDLYINYHKGIHMDHYRVSLTSQWSLEKRYSKSNCCETKDIGMRDVRCDSQYICLSIMQQDDLKWRLDIMSRDMKRIRRGVVMDAGEN
ncbi:unnamed protein product [Rotaria socialis]|uniref:Uncharacterized protein n=1 Tax=Rotaria socialis TaxID=392032 RepID=A0A821NA67_9BILA|nr:unnamed protein product [Rotaria socialis]